MENKKKHIPRCPSDKMLERIIKILASNGDIHTSGGGCTPSPDSIRNKWYTFKG